MALTRERFEQLVARSPDIVVGTDRRGTVIFYNDGATESLGYEPAEVLGAHVGIFYPDLDEARRVAKAMREGDDGRGGGGVANFRTTFVSKAGEKIPVAISGTILHEVLPSGERVEDGTIGFAKDLREILKKDQLATLGEVAIGLSHEINNPLAVILNQAELLEHDVHELAGERECAVEIERLDAIRREIARISEILERLTEMARGEVYETVDYVGPARMVDLRQKDLRERRADPRLGGARVLVVDDDGGVRRSLTEILADRGLQRRRGGGRRRGDRAPREGALRRRDLRRRHAPHGRLRALHHHPEALARAPGADDDGLPLRQGPHHQAEAGWKGSPA